MIVAVQIGLIGLVADLIANNRILIEDTLYRIKKIETKESASEAEENGQPLKHKVKSQVKKAKQLKAD